MPSTALGLTKHIHLNLSVFPSAVEGRFIFLQADFKTRPVNIRIVKKNVHNKTPKRVVIVYRIIHLEIKQNQNA